MVSREVWSSGNYAIMSAGNGEIFKGTMVPWSLCKRCIIINHRISLAFVVNSWDT
jgi:hypothetical protein